MLGRSKSEAERIATENLGIVGLSDKVAVSEQSLSVQHNEKTWYFCGAGCRLGDPDCPCTASDGACHLCDGVDPDCATTCAADGACVDACLAPDPDCRAQEEGAACTDGIECASSICLRGTCREPCAPATGAGCPPWASCVATDGDLGACLPTQGVGVRGGCGVARATRSTGAPTALLLSLLALVAARRRAALARPIPPGRNRSNQGDWQ